MKTIYVINDDSVFSDIIKQTVESTFQVDNEYQFDTFEKAKLFLLIDLRNMRNEYDTTIKYIEQLNEENL